MRDADGIIDVYASSFRRITSLAERKELSSRRWVRTSSGGQIRGMIIRPMAVGTYSSHSGWAVAGGPYCEIRAPTKATLRLMVKLGKMTEAMIWKRRESMVASTEAVLHCPESVSVTLAP